MAETESSQVLAVASAGRVCAIPISNVVETMRALPIAPVAGAPSALLGLAVIRGEPTPVLDLGALLASARTEVRRLVTLEVDGRAVALGVEEVLGVRRVDTARFGDMPPLLRGADSELIASIGSSDQQLLVVLHAARLVPDAVWTSLQAGVERA